MLNLNKIAETICEKNQNIVDYVKANKGNNHKGVRRELDAIARGLSEKYNEGKFIKSDDLRRLTWRIIDIVEGNISPNAIKHF